MPFKTHYKWICNHSHSNADKWNRCNICRRADYRKTHPEIIPQTEKDRQLRAAFKITEAEYITILTEQNGVCAICKRPETATRLGKVKALAVDHSHSTSKNRGLLCQKCNVGLGHFEDNQALLLAAVEYLKRFN